MRCVEASALPACAHNANTTGVQVHTAQVDGRHAWGDKGRVPIWRQEHSLNRGLPQPQPRLTGSKCELRCVLCSIVGRVLCPNTYSVHVSWLRGETDRRVVWLSFLLVVFNCFVFVVFRRFCFPLRVNAVCCGVACWLCLTGEYSEYRWMGMPFLLVRKIVIG